MNPSTAKFAPLNLHMTTSSRKKNQNHSFNLPTRPKVRILPGKGKKRIEETQNHTEPQEFYRTVGTLQEVRTVLLCKPLCVLV
jgi:hypothetical protein